MKARFGVCLVSWLLLVACSNRPDTAIFGDLPGGPNEPAGTSGSGNADAAGNSAIGGSAAEPIAGVGGSSASTGGSDSSVAGTVSNGGSTEPSPEGGSAGSNDEPPVEEPTATCGNGELEEGEQCDDENEVAGDGCSEQCQVVCSDFAEGSKMSADFHCYAGFDDADFMGAVTACEKLGAHLVTVGSEAENEVVRSLVSSSKWIGATDGVALMSEAAGEYTWVTGEPFEFENWSEEQPDRAGERCNQYSLYPRCFEHCGFMQGNGRWADARCDTSDGYVCEWEPRGD